MVFAGAVDYHPAGLAHGFGEPSDPSGSSFSHAAVHPGQPQHLEASDVVSRPHCPICLHRLQTAGSHLAVLSACALPAWRGALFADFATAIRTASLHPWGARGPPSRLIS
jgi:hypothetical protein